MRTYKKKLGGTTQGGTTQECKGARRTNPKQDFSQNWVSKKAQFWANLGDQTL